MKKEAVATGETVEIAFSKACDELGVETTDAECDIIELPTKKTFGLFGGNPAKVRAIINVNDNPAEEAAEFLKNVLTKMGVRNISVDIVPEEGGAALTLNGEDIGFVIGYRGETLDSLQYLASLVANHAEENYFRITLDIGNYREKRRETLEILGKKLAIKSIKLSRNTVLEPMNPYERRIIHTAVQTVEGAKSWSEGEDLARHVVIGPVDGEKNPRRDYGRGKPPRGGYKGKQQSQSRPGGRPPYNKPHTNSNSQQKRTEPKKDDPSAPIYGRIDLNK